MTGKTLTVFFFTIFLLGITARAEAVLFGDPLNPVDFPDGEISFADSFYSYTQGTSGSSVLSHTDPATALGIPDFWVTDDILDQTYVSLGYDGELVLQFTDNYLTTSGDDGLDLWIFEVGPDVEATAIDISIDGAIWISVGSVGGATAGIDIDSFADVTDGDLYSYVRLTDLTPAGNRGNSSYAGADIDAVGAISTIAADPGPSPVPEPSTMLLLVAGLFGLAAFRARFEPSV